MIKEKLDLWISQVLKRLKQHLGKITLTILIGLFGLVYAYPAMFVVVNPGEGGVLFDILNGGVDTTYTYHEGMAVIWPWNKLYIYDTRVQERTFTIDALSNNGLTVMVEVSLRWRPRYQTLGFLHKIFGPQYVERLVIPEAESSIRTVIGNYRPEDLYSLQRSHIQGELLKQHNQSVGHYYIETDRLLLESIKLPHAINLAIEHKLEKQQQSEEYEFILEAERQEAIRKRIEASGDASYQSLIGQTLTKTQLDWEGVRTTLELANSVNPKVVIIGGGSNKNIPVIMGNQ